MDESILWVTAVVDRRAALDKRDKVQSNEMNSFLILIIYYVFYL